MHGWWNRLTRSTAPDTAAPPAAGAMALGSDTEVGVDDDAAAASSGWFESSWDLRKGLSVVEAPALELAVWQLVQGDAPRR